MEFTIDHRTTYRYAAPVDQSYTVVHLQPRSDGLQFCSRYALELSPGTKSYAYRDRFGNDVQHFSIMPPHAELTISAHSDVVTLMPPSLPPENATRAALAAQIDDLAFYDYLHASTYVCTTPELDAFLDNVGRPGDDLGAWCENLRREVHGAFTYDTSATTVRTTVAEALRERRGVCQDYAHVMLSSLRTVGIPARYVSGYIFRGESPVLGAEASHAWVEAYLPPHGWVGFDPTNDLAIDNRFVRIAYGRDYRDVSPIRGVYRGVQSSEMRVDVEMNLFASQ